MSIRFPLREDELKQKIKEISPFTYGFDLVSDHVVITDENANILFANKGVRENTGFARDEAINKTPADLWGGKMPKEFYEKMWHQIKVEKKPFVGEVHNVNKDGKEYWQDLHISPILDEAGNVKYFIGIELNITDRKQRDQFRDEFVSIVSHQLRNPLVSMRWLLELLLSRKTLTDEDRAKLLSIYHENDDLSKFINNLLILSRAERLRASPINKELINLTDELKGLIQEVKQHNPATDFSFIADEAFPLSVNKSLAMQIFSNLIYNAAEYSNRENSKVAVAIKRSDKDYVFSCHNNGAEILPEEKPRIFTKLFRSDNATQMREGGTGLGLFIVKTIADSLDWRVWFESGAGKGTTFYVQIPNATA